MAMSLFGKKPAEKPAEKPAPGTRPRGEPTTTMDLTQLGDMGRALAAAAGKIQVNEGSGEGHAALEEAAILYANASDDAACAVLEAAIDGAIGPASEDLWVMLFDLYRLVGARDAFDTRAVAYSKIYEISPPMWDENDKQAAPTQERRQSAPAVNLSGTLAGNAKSQFEQLVRIGQKMGSLRIDFSRLKGIEESGCNLLISTLNQLKAQKTVVTLLGAKHALALVEPKLVVGERGNQDFWLLALALIQQSADAERFDDVALNYAITFEESPPAYEAPPVSETAEPEIEPVAEPEPATSKHFMLSGSISGNQPQAFIQLNAYASDKNLVDIDCSELKRLEFVSAGSLFNVLAQLQGQGKHLLIHRPNALVCALMRVMGIDQLARIERRKT